MRIEALNLHGFKSFPDRTRIEFHEGLTAIVGPNGCGKSNISDALRWVLGEQRPTAIRGSRMEEAIFGGSMERRPIHRAEVSLELSNEDRTLPLPYSEVVVGRTVYRGGESDYSLNGSDCRLRDIQDLCRDTGLGANAYAMIESRMIDSILSDRAEERRALFEEAAEIGRYKDRRRTALRRLEQAEGDLTRLDDVLGEVQSKVRSLAQQRGRAERHRTFRERRLRLEVAIADVRLERTEERLIRAREELGALEEARPSEEAGLRTMETEAETLRVRLAERERDRSVAARELDTVRQELEERERERLVASERATAARSRVQAIGEELARLERRREELRADQDRAETRRSEEQAAVDDLGSREASLRREVEALAGARRAAEEEEEGGRRVLDEAARELGQLEASRESAKERLEERSDELARRREALDAVESRRAELEGRLETARREAESAEVRERERAEAFGERSREVEARREAAREARGRVASLEGDLSSARARESSLAGFIASGGGLPDAVSRLLESRAVDGVQGVLSACISTSTGMAGAVEAHLGPYLHGLVVRDWATVRAVREWLNDAELEGGLLLLPLDPGPREGGSGTSADGGASLLDRIDVSGPGAAWVRALLADVRVQEDGTLEPAPGPWVRPDGSGRDAVGAVRIGAPGPGRGTLRRRVELEEMRERARALEAELEAARETLAEEEGALEEAVRAADALEARGREASEARRAAEAEREAVEERLRRTREEAAELAERIAALETARKEARTRAESVADRSAEFREARERAERALAEARERARAARASWEERRDELHALQLRTARREADLESAAETVRRAAAALSELEDRERRLHEERESQERVATGSRDTVRAAEERLESMFETRRELEERLREAEERLEADRAELERRETALREARKREREHSERRHELELELADLRARRSGVRDRLEAEWDASLEELRDRVEPLEEGGLEEWEAELEDVRRKLHRLGPVNLLAEEEYGEERERLDFLEEQRSDLVDARDDLRESIRRINRTAAENFQSTFREIRENFQATFLSLFEGGECDVWLEDPEDPLDSPIEISASPRGKRTQRIHLLSGGERALTALALLFAIYRTKPSPFCLMDEVDAPLDEANILRFVRMLERFKEDTQFIIITHNPRTIEAADYIYGVTMQEPGVSSVVGVTFDEARSQVA